MGMYRGKIKQYSLVRFRVDVLRNIALFNTVHKSYALD